ncbi:MAG: hypothetical protein F4213_18280 [Boseongicola sp. SB0677_bin_26]|nr:hypothetical protein [Boseongicola sp. SB0665_bin_10]MYG27941.1 hypothetical protein [Boseongicola sp. SB0677_bin_26]
MPKLIHILAATAAASVALLLAGCGGGDDGDLGYPTSRPHAIDRIAKSADTLLMSDLLVSSGFLDVRIQSRCAGTMCRVTALGEAAEVSLSDLADGSANDWPEATAVYREVSLAREVGFDVVDDLITEGEAYAGWLDHNFFLVGHATFLDADLGRVGIPVSMSIGDATGSNPLRGSAT